MSNRRIHVHLGTAEDMRRRFVNAWRRTASGESVREEHLTFVDFKQMLGTLSDERLRLLKEVRREEAVSLRELAGRLNRDYKNVYDDVRTACLIHQTLLRATESRCSWYNVDDQPDCPSAEAVAVRLGADRRSA